MQKIKIFLGIFLLTAILIAVSCFFIYKGRNINLAALIIHEQEPEYITLASPYNSREFYEKIFEILPKSERETSNVFAAIVSHHMLAKAEIAELYNKIASEKIQTIFLLSPDHYNNFFAPEVTAYTSKASWNTPYEKLEADSGKIDLLLKSGMVDSKASAIGLEHGIYTQIPFIKKFFPNAEIVPLVLNLNAKSEKFYELGKKLKELGAENSLLIVSSDFSHDSTIAEALGNDIKSINVLKNLNKDSFGQITSDCKQCIAAMESFLPEGQSLKFNIAASKNSFDISGQGEDSVTSYIFGYYTQKNAAQILFVGDLMFDRGIRYYADKAGSNEFIFEKIRPQLLNQDLVVANLEGPITENKSRSLGTVPGSANNYIFTFDPSLAKTLYYQNIGLVGLGNNHILNFGNAGLESTKEYLKEAGIDYFGGPDTDKSIIKTIDGIKIAFVNYNEFSGSLALEQSQTISEIQKLKGKADFIVVFCHWDVEYQTEPTEATKTLAHQFVNAGADLIIGSHPHVVQITETYNNKKIYYSLGNFVFDQYFDENVRKGLGVILKVNPRDKSVQFEEIHFYLDSGGQTSIK